MAKMKEPSGVQYILKQTRQALEISQITAFFAQNASTPAAKSILRHPPQLGFQQLSQHVGKLGLWMEFFEHNDPIGIPELPDKEWFKRNPHERPLDFEELRCIRDLIIFWKKTTDNQEIRDLADLSPGGFPDEKEKVEAAFCRLKLAFGAQGDWSPNLTSKYSKLVAEESRISNRLDHLLQEKVRLHSDQLTEPVIFERNGRRVLAVNKAYKRKVPGILQDYSTSGQTAFIEPDTSTPLQNRLQEIFFEKREEIFKFRVEISKEIQNIPFLKGDLIQLITRMDMFQALALTARQTNSHPVMPNQTGNLDLVDARHPFLDEQFAALRAKETGETDPNKMVVFSLHMDADKRGFIISGANAGGKTVTLKTVGVIAWLANAGYPVPVHHDSEIPFYDYIFADIGDHQSLSHNLSTYASHLYNMKLILDQKDAKCLILLDELGSGTDPQEGNALAQVLIEEFLKRDVHLLVTTHQQVLCSFALNETALGNASMTFDQHRLVPTFHFIQGVPGRSHALEIAERSGLPAQLLARAKSLVDENQMDIQQAILRLQEQNKAMEKQKSKFKKEERRALRRIVEARQEKDKYEKLQSELKEKESAKLQLAVKKIEKEFRDLLKSVESKKTRQKLVQEFSAKQKDLLKDQPETEPVIKPEGSGIAPAKWRAGDQVFLKSWQKKARILSLDLKKIRVDVGGMTLTVKHEDIVHVSGKDVEKPSGQVHVYSEDVSSRNIPLEIKLLGLTREEALDELSRTVDAAFMQHPAMLKIVHGHGHGILKAAVREFLERHPLRGHWESTIDPENDGTTDLHFRWI